MSTAVGTIIGLALGAAAGWAVGRESGGNGAAVGTGVGALAGALGGALVGAKMAQASQPAPTSPTSVTLVPGRRYQVTITCPVAIPPVPPNLGAGATLVAQSQPSAGQVIVVFDYSGQQQTLPLVEQGCSVQVQDIGPSGGPPPPLPPPVAPPSPYPGQMRTLGISDAKESGGQPIKIAGGDTITVSLPQPTQPGYAWNTNPPSGVLFTGSSNTHAASAQLYDDTYSVDAQLVSLSAPGVEEYLNYTLTDPSGNVASRLTFVLTT